MKLGRGVHSGRSQAAPLGVALVFALVIVGTGVIILMSSGAITETENQLGVNRAEQTLTQLDAEMAKVALGNTDSQSIQLGNSRNDYQVNPKAGWLTVKMIDASTTPTTTTKYIDQRDLGEIVYKGGETTVAYQGGGVWKKTGNGSVMVSPPEFHYRDGTLTLPLITVGSEDSNVGGRVSIGKKDADFPSVSNPLKNAIVKVIVKSEYYQAWGTYFETRTGGEVSYDHANSKVTMKLVRQEQKKKIKNGFIVLGGSGSTLNLQSGNNFVIDSYDSDSISPNRATTNPPSTAGVSDIITNLNVDFTGNAQISGTLKTTGEIVDWGSGAPCPPKCKIGGDLYSNPKATVTECTQYVKDDPGQDCHKMSSNVNRDTINAEVISTITSLKSVNDNAGPDYSNGKNYFSKSSGFIYHSGNAKLEAGKYYTNGKLVINNPVTLDTSNGDIIIAVDNNKKIKITSKVTVKGDGQVRIYHTNELFVKGGEIVNKGWDASQFWSYCDADCTVKLRNGARFVGVVYAPQSSSTSASLVVKNGNVEVYGAIVGGGDAELKANADIHFDTALETARIFPKPTVPTVSYLHLSVNEVEVDG